MRVYIKKLQSKPEETRKQILVGSLVISMSLVGVIWISSLSYKFSKENVVTKTQSQNVARPFALFGQTIKDTYSNVTASVGNISKTIKEEKAKVTENTTTEKQVGLIPVEYTNQ